jgi:transcriptional regulator with XRE-family HTH domain
MVELAKRSRCSRYTIGRWLSGRARPRVHEFLRLLDAITGRACDLVAELVPIAKVPSLARAHEARSAARRLAHEEPWTEAILRVLESRPYRSGQVARLLGIDLATEQRCIDKLLLSGVVHRRGRKLEVSGELSVDTRAAATLKAHWAGVAHARLSRPRPSDLFTYNVLSAAPEDVDLIRDRLRATYREIRMIVANSRSADSIALVNLQLLDWSGEAEDDS